MSAELYTEHSEQTAKYGQKIYLARSLIECPVRSKEGNCDILELHNNKLFI